MPTTKTQTVDALVADLGELRRRCVQAHNVGERLRRLSILQTLISHLPVSPALEVRSAGHLLLSNYAFWGHSDLTGRRVDFDQRLQMQSPGHIWALQRRLRQADFGAWLCVDEPGLPTWQFVGPADADTAAIDVITDVHGNPVGAESGEIQPGEMRAGWHIEADDGCALAYAMRLDRQAADRIREAGQRRAWDDPGADADQTNRPIDYARDVLAAAVSADYDDLGLDRYHFLPLHRRSVFPQTFGRALFRQLVSPDTGPDWYWHIAVAGAQTPQDRQGLRQQLDELRHQAGRRATGWRSSAPTLSALRRLVDDRALLAVLGTDPDGSVDLSAFSAISSHPLSVLGLGQPWFDATGCSPSDLVGGALDRVGGDDSPADTPANPTQAQLHDAVAGHRTRLRWVCAIDYAVSGAALADNRLLDGDPDRLQPDYDGLRAAIAQIFGDTIAQRPLADVLPADGRCAGRIQQAVARFVDHDNPLNVSDLTVGDLNVSDLNVSDLPETSDQLWALRGIGPATINALEASLRTQLLAWPPQLDRRDSAGQTAHKTLSDGLDDLDDLF